MKVESSNKLANNQLKFFVDNLRRPDTSHSPPLVFRKQNTTRASTLGWDDNGKCKYLSPATLCSRFDVLDKETMVTCSHSGAVRTDINITVSTITHHFLHHCVGHNIRALPCDSCPPQSCKLLASHVKIEI